MTAPIRIGFIGTGAMGQCAHLANYVGLPGAEIAAITEVRPRLAAMVARRYGLDRAYADHRDMLAGERLDALVCIQQFSRHGRLLPDVLAAGVPVLIEKPLARSLTAADAILAAAGTTPLFVAYHKRSDPATVWARERIRQWRADGSHGKLRYLRLSMPPGDWQWNGFVDQLRSDEPVPSVPPDPTDPGLDGNRMQRFDSFVNYYIHQINLARHLLDGGWTIDHADPSGIVLVGHGEDGVTVVLEMSAFRSPQDWQESVLATFDTGWVRLDLPSPLVRTRPGRVVVFSDRGQGADGAGHSEPLLPPVHAMRAQAANFVRAVRGEATPLCTASAARADLVNARQWLDLMLPASSALH